MIIVTILDGLEVIDLDGKIFPYDFESFKRLSKNRVISIIPKSNVFPQPETIKCFNDCTLIIKERIIGNTEEGIATMVSFGKSNHVKFSPMTDKEIRDMLLGERAYVWPHHHYMFELQNLN